MPSIEGEITVLCVDDNPAEVDCVATLLEDVDEQFTVRTATSVRAGIEAFEEGGVDCIVSDYAMPGIDGLQFLQAVRADHPDVPFILYTGKGSEDLASEAISAGVTDYVQKPEKPDEHELLAQRIRNAVTRYRVRHEVERANERARTILEASPDAILVSVDGAIVYANRAAVDLFAVGAESDLRESGIPELAHPDDADAFLADFEPLRHGREPIEQLRHTFQTRDGEPLEVELTARRIAWEDETGIVTILRDVTERHQQKEKLEEKRRQLAGVLDAVSAAIFMKDRDGRYLLMNENCRKLLGVDLERDVVGLTDEDLLPEPSATKYRSDDDRVFEAGETIEIEEEVPTPDGTQIHLTRKTPLFEDGEPYALVGVSTDITAQKTRERQLRERIKELSAIRRVVTLFGGHDRPLEEILEDIAETVPESFQHPASTATRIQCGRHEVTTSGFQADAPRLTATAATAGGTEVVFDVAALEAHDASTAVFDDGPFLDEEQDLIEVLTRIVCGYVERREYVEQLERDETILRTLGDAVYALDADGHFEYVNDALVALSGYGRGELLGEHVSMLLPEADFRRSLDHVERLLDRGGDSVMLEIDLVAADGERIPTETQIALLPPDESGDFRGTAGVTRDITDRKKHERELQRQRDMLLRTEQLADVGGWELDGETVRWTAGTYEIHGMPLDYEPILDEAIGFYHPEDRETIREAVEQCRAEGDSYDLELRLITAEGRERWVNARGERVEEAGTRILRGTVQDITESKETEQQLMVLNRVLRHNLRNNLNVVTSNVELLRSSLESVDSADAVPFSLDGTSEQLDQIEAHAMKLINFGEKARRLSETIEGVDLAASVGLAALLGDIAASYREASPDATITVDAADEQVVANRDAVRLVFEELLDNALEHADSPDPEISIDVSKLSTERVAVRVADDGPGIPDVERKALTRGAETALNHGSGLGLWTVNWLLTRIGGSVRIADNDPCGTVVTVELPATDGR